MRATQLIAPSSSTRPRRSVAVTGVNGATRTFPYSTNVDVTSISGTCGTASGDLTAVNWWIGLRSGSATCSAGTWASGTFAAISADGTYTADATQADAAGNAGNATDRTVIVDKTAPSVAVTGVNGATRTFPYSTNVDVTSICRNVRHRQRRPDRGQLVDRPALGLGGVCARRGLGRPAPSRQSAPTVRIRPTPPRQTPPAMPATQLIAPSSSTRPRRRSPSRPARAGMVTGTKSSVPPMTTRGLWP